MSNLFRVCVQGIEKFSSDFQVYKLFKKILGEQSVEIQTISKPKKKPFAFIGLKSEEDEKEFTNLINQYIQDNKKAKKWKIKSANTDSFNIKMEKSIEELIKISESKAQMTRDSGEANKEDFENMEIQEKVCPLWKTPYEEQISLKEKILEKVLKNVNKECRKLLKQDDIAPSFLNNSKFCEISEFIKSENPDYYRNKSEFSIGKSQNGEIKIGFNKGKFEKGVMFVESGSECPIISKEAIVVAEHFEKFISESGFDIYDRFKNEGVWRNLVVRQSNRTKEILISLYINQKTLSLEELEKLKAQLILEIPNLMEYDILKSFNMNGFLLFNHCEISDNIPFDCQFEILQGNSFYHEIILGKKFRVSHSAFLQVNTNQCELLYAKVKEFSGLDSYDDGNIVLFDLCSGIGTIGLTIGEKAKKVIGVEVIESACKDAEWNAKENNVSNYETICAKVEDCISEISKEYSGKSTIIGIVDPPRGGLHGDVLKALRTCKGLDNLIYVSCNPNSLASNLVPLCMPEGKKRKAPPFEPVKLLAVDMFPHTHHFETLVKLKRMGS